MKTCPRCKTEKPDTDFYRWKTGRNVGMLFSYCKICVRKQERTRRSIVRAWAGFRRIECMLGISRYHSTAYNGTSRTFSACHLKEAKAMLDGKNTRNKNKCVKLPGDDET